MVQVVFFVFHFSFLFSFCFPSAGIPYSDVTEFREEIIYLFIFQLRIWIQTTGNNKKQCQE